MPIKYNICDYVAMGLATGAFLGALYVVKDIIISVASKIPHEDAKFSDLEKTANSENVQIKPNRILD